MEDPWIILTEWYWPENKERRAELTPSHMVSDTSLASNGIRRIQDRFLIKQRQMY